MVGDAWNMRHPLTGGGMTVALHDAVLLTEYLRPSKENGDGGLVDLHDWEDIRTRLHDWYWRRKHLAGVVNILSIALYDLFGANGELETRWTCGPYAKSRSIVSDDNLAVLRDGCFKYFELGGQRVAGPVGLLSA
jgi:squalene monooxygenase